MASAAHLFEVFPARTLRVGERPVVQWTWRGRNRVRSALPDECFNSLDACLEAIRQTFGGLEPQDVRITLDR